MTDSTRGSTRGMIHFVVFQNRVRFHIDAQQASENGLAISSKLLALGLSVKR
ncbi:YfiR family protein [Phenylobacterium sp. J367]|uniref:YfiR family protein n=1 Tax=Phenylobacterium sp. J367 TaxID=2898435 RepID=UPI0035B42436